MHTNKEPVKKFRALYRPAMRFCLPVLLLVGAQAVAAPELNPNHPDRYTVQKGDTLWGIASRFLTDPWRWPEIWQRNPEIENPHLIYPGDVLVMTRGADGDQLKVLRQRKMTKLSPATRSEPIEEAIPTIPPDAILPFLTAPLVIEEGGLTDAGYVAAGQDGKFTLGRYSVFYARGLPYDEDQKFYNIYRPGKRLVHPVTNEFLGLQALHVGFAQMLKRGDVAKLEVVRSHREISPGDRMRAVPRDIGLPYFEPRAPDGDVRGYVVDFPDGVAETGPLSVVVVSVGERENIQPGHVLRILRQEPLRKDPVTGKLFQPPPESSGLLMVFRTFEKVSYALVMSASYPVHLRDIVQTP